MKNIFLSGLHLLFAGLLLGQNGTSTFEGRIIEAAPSARGVSFALIQADDAFTYSDLDGFFEITLAKGQATIEVSQLGYETTTFELSSGQDNYILPSSPILLEQVLVSSTLQYSQPQSDTWIDPAQQITQARDIGDLFRDIPGFGLSRKGGFAVDPTFRGFKYEQLNVIYDGGAQTTYACPGRMDPATTHINPQEVEKIEGLYPLVKEQLILRTGKSGKTVRYEKVVPLLVEAIKEQQRQIDELTKKIEEL